GRGDRAGLPVLPPPQGAPDRAVRLPLGGRAADARDRPRPHVRPAGDPARRAVARPRPDARRGDLRHRRAAEPGAADHRAARRAERHPGPGHRRARLRDGERADRARGQRGRPPGQRRHQGVLPGPHRCRRQALVSRRQALQAAQAVAVVRIFGEQHEMFRQAVRSFVEREVAPHIDAWEAAGQIPKSIWPRMGQQGFLGVEYDEKYGGGGADFLTTAVLCEEAARSRCAAFAMALGVHTDMASPHLYWTGSEALKEKYLPRICRGEALTAIAATEPGGRSDVAAIRTRAARDGAAYVLNGSKMFITNGVLADLYFVAARIESGGGDKRHRGISMFLVERDTPGFTVSRKLDKMGNRASDTAEL